MQGERALWLVNNASSGSNDDAALAALEQCCGEHGFRVARRTVFPAEDLPTPAALEAAGIGRVAVFAGDGTVNALIAALAGWGGAVLVLPGGTMNLLYNRLHGERSLDQVVAAVARGAARVHRPGVIRTPLGDAYAGLLAGPGTSWGRVREAMRDKALAELAESTVEAIDETLTGEMIVCVEPPLGRAEGYPLLSLTPHDGGIEVEAYFAETAGQYLEQAWALLRRNFREGPHDTLGQADSLRLGSTRGNRFGLLLDGEQAEAGPQIDIRLARCEVDLLATQFDAD
ncbi:MAG TPA: diacylglycerol kinase family protein [Croceibacterium sp.]|nr:diacylglycerol kinase family protein [Croceibacterium sp.]